MLDLMLATAGGVLLAAADIATRALRLRVLLGTASPKRVHQAVAVNAFGDTASALTPARLGGEPARFLALRVRGTPTPTSVVVLAAERVVDMGLAAVVTVAAIALLGTRGFGDLTDYVGRFASSRAVPWVVAVAVLVAVFGVVTYRFRGRLPRGGATLHDAVAQARELAGWRLVGAVALTLASMAARVSVLPLLLWRVNALGDPLTAFVGSFALIYAQLLLPTPAGAGAVELGFVLALAPTLDPGDVASLLITWRLITLGIPAGLGGLVLARGAVRSEALARVGWWSRGTFGGGGGS